MSESMKWHVDRMRLLKGVNRELYEDTTAMRTCLFHKTKEPFYFKSRNAAHRKCPACEYRMRAHDQAGYEEEGYLIGE